MATDHAGAWNDIFPEWDYRFQNSGTPTPNIGTGGQSLVIGAGSPSFQDGGLGAGPTSTTYCVSFDGTADKVENDGVDNLPGQTATEGAVAVIFKGPTDSSKRSLWQMLDNASPFEKFEMYKRREDADPALSGILLFRFQDNVSDSYWWIHDRDAAGYIDPFDDNWHIAVVRQKADGSTGLELWVDGQSQTIYPLGANGPGYTTDWWMSSNFDASSSATEYTVGGNTESSVSNWHGEIAGFGVATTAPSDAQIIQMAEDFEFDTGGAKFTVKTRRNANRHMVYDYT